MKILLSLLLWTIGSLFFLCSSPIIVFCLIFMPKNVTFCVAKFLFGIQIRIMGIRLEVTGKENVQADRPYLIMGNHQSLFDLFVVVVSIPLVFSAIEAAYHFSIPIWGYFIKKWGVIPIERNNFNKALISLEMAKKTLASGMHIAILPEGHRTVTGKLGEFKKGPFYMAKDTNADILPFAFNGLFNYNKKGSLIITPGVVRVNIGEPITRDEINNMDVEMLRSTVFNCVNELSQK